MKIFKAKLEEIIGLLIGLVFWYLWLFVVITMSFEINFYAQTQISIWVSIGLLILFMFIGHYIVSSGVIDEKKRIEDIVIIKSNLIGYFLWLILMIFAYLLNIEVSSNASLAGGYIAIFLIYLYMKKRVIKAERQSSC